MEYFYDGQVRRYLAQALRMLAGFKTRAGDGTEKVVPVLYGDMTRQVAQILKNNSENTLPSAPRITLYISDIELDTSRLADASYINKIHIRERAIDPVTNTYTTSQGQNYTIERLMPTPYKLTFKADIWTTNTDQKLQILEQILVLFNPSFEIQTTDNYVDWTSLTVVYLQDVTFSSRSIPVGVDSDIDVATMEFETPIWLTPPGAVKRLGVVQTVISNIFTETGELTPDFIGGQPASPVYVTPGNYGIIVTDNRIKLVSDGEGVTDNAFGLPIKYGQDVNWFSLLDQYGEFRAGASTIFLKQPSGADIVGTAAVDPTDQTVLLVNWDPDTYPTNTVISGRSSIDAIIDPLTYNPKNVANGIRYLILNSIGDPTNTTGPLGWKNSDTTDFYANENDIIEWDGSNWNIVFPASTVSDIAYTRNLKTGTQYKWDGEVWTKSFDGEYMAGLWRIAL
jgi:hypothetical protein